MRQRNLTALQALARRVDDWHWLILALASPLLIFPAPSRILALGIVPGLWLVAWLAGREPLPRTPFNLALLLMAFMLLVSLWATFDITLSLPKISGLLLGFGVFFAFARETAGVRGARWGVLLFLALGLAVALLGFVGTSWFTQKIALFDAVTGRLPKLINGLQGAETGFHPNEVAGALLWLLPLMFSLSLALLRQRRSAPPLFLALLLVGAGFATLVFLLSQSRGGYLGLAFSLSALLLIVLPLKLRRLSLSALTFAVFAFTAWAAPRWQSLLAWLSNSGVSSNSAFSLASIDSRLEIWSRAIYGIQDFPLTGMGMNTFRVAARVFYPMFSIPLDFDFGHAHNEFLQAALDLGIPGLVAFLALHLIAAWALVAAWRAAPTEASLLRAVTLGLGGGLLAHLLYGLTDAVALGAKPGLLFWMLLGLIAGIYALATNTTDDAVQKREGSLHD